MNGLPYIFLISSQVTEAGGQRPNSPFKVADWVLFVCYQLALTTMRFFFISRQFSNRGVKILCDMLSEQVGPLQYSRLPGQEP